jgi:hypothetical protein
MSGLLELHFFVITVKTKTEEIKEAALCLAFCCAKFIMHKNVAKRGAAFRVDRIRNPHSYKSAVFCMHMTRNNDVALQVHCFYAFHRIKTSEFI